MSADLVGLNFEVCTSAYTLGSCELNAIRNAGASILEVAASGGALSTLASAEGSNRGQLMLP